MEEFIIPCFKHKGRNNARLYRFCFICADALCTECSLLKYPDHTVACKACGFTKVSYNQLQTEIGEIHQNLQLVGQPDLYAFLGISRTASLSELQHIVSQQHMEIQQPSQSAEATAGQELLGQAQAIFADSQMRLCYDLTLQEQRLQSLDSSIEQAVCQGQLSRENFACPVSQGVALGVSAPRSLDYVIRLCKQKGWHYSLPEALAECLRPELQTSPPPASSQLQAVPKPAPKSPATHPCPARFTNDLGMEFVLIQPGSFIMGSPEDEFGRSVDEQQHQVTLTQAFYLQTTPVTQAQWGGIGDKADLQYPVSNASWLQVQNYIQKLNQLGQGQYRLPTEAEWEYACRAGSSTAYCFGDDPRQLGDYAWYERNASRDARYPVGQKKPNAWGLYDMHGHVWEWVQDGYGWGYSREAVTDPCGAGSGPYRVFRGGSQHDSAQHARSAFRYGNVPDVLFGGFRLLRLCKDSPAESPLPRQEIQRKPFSISRFFQKIKWK